MTRTLADMTPAERQECVGMWCDNLVSAAKTPDPVVLSCVQGELCWILHTTLHGSWSCFPLDAVAPRSDLPRAWTPSGEPVDTMSHSNELRELALGASLASQPEKAAAARAGADALDTLPRVRDVLTDLRGRQEAALQRWGETCDPWDGATSVTLRDTVNLLTEALEGDTP